IDGGREWVAWHSPVNARLRNPPRFVPLPRGLNWLTDQGEFDYLPGTYAVSFSRAVYDVKHNIIPSRIIASETYRLWLSPQEHKVFVLKYVPTPDARPPGG